MWVMIGINRANARKQEKKFYENGEKIASIIDRSYNAMQDIINSDNFKMTRDAIYDYGERKDIIHREVLSKDGNIKEIHNDEYNGEKFVYTNYGAIQGEYFFFIQVDEYNRKTTNGGKYGITASTSYNPLEFAKRHILDFGYHEIRDEKIDGVEYYVIRRIYDTAHGVTNMGDSEGSYEDVWINKENMLVYKIIYENVREIGKSREEIFTWEKGYVIDEDVKCASLTKEDLEEIKKTFYIMGFDFDSYKKLS